jgi:hypothetical protein
MFAALVVSVVADAANKTPFVLVQLSATDPAVVVQSPPVKAGSWEGLAVPETAVNGTVVDDAHGLAPLQ